MKAPAGAGPEKADSDQTAAQGAGESQLQIRSFAVQLNMDDKRQYPEAQQEQRPAVQEDPGHRQWNYG